MRDRSDLYYECHVTIEPPSRGADVVNLEGIIAVYGFRMSTFAMITKDEEPKAFVSARGESYAVMVRDVTELARQLRLAGFKILRYKIEDTLIDTKKQGDILGILQ